MHFRLKQFGAFLVLFSAALFAAAPPLHAQSDADKTGKLVRLMKEDGYDYKTTTSPTVFIIHFTGDHLKDIKVVLALGGDADSDLIAFVTVTPKANMPTTADFRYTLLKTNYQYDQVKVGLDNDDDLSVRIDGSMRLADAAYLKVIIDQLKSSSNEIYGKIQPSLLH
ncbi:MAG: hypothetical protein ABSD59_01135 [Terracidiphilus sp.]|jgi:hypothetical protein